MGWDSFSVVRFDLGPLLQGHMRIDKLKSAYKSLIIDPRACIVNSTYGKSWAGNLLMLSNLTLGPSFKVKQGWPKIKVLITHLFLVLEVFSVTPTYRKSWAKNL